MFVWTLLGVGLAVLIFYAILSLRMERAKHTERQWDRSVAARAAEQPSAERALRNP